MQISKDFTIDEDAYVEFCYKTASGRNYITVAITAVLVIIMSVVFKFAETTEQSILFGVLYAAIYVAIVLVFSRLTTKKAAKKAYNTRGINNLQVHLSFSDDGIYQSVAGAEPVKLEWAEIKKVVETKLAYFLYVSSTQAVLVCKKCIEQIDVDTIREIIKKNATAKCKLRLQENKSEIIEDNEKK